MAADEFGVTADNTPTRERHRVGYDRAAAYEAIDAALICHVGFVADGKPVVLPQLHVRVGDELYLHGSTGARALRAAKPDGVALCVTVTHVDGIVLARSAFNHSINFRSVVVHGTAVEVTDVDAKRELLTRFVDGVVPGRSEQVRGANARELAATSLLRLPLENASIKVRTGPPEDEPEDLDLPYWAGVIPLTNLLPGEAEPAPEMTAGRPVPEHVRGWKR